MINAAIYELTESNQVISIDTLTSSVQGAEVKVRGFEIEAVGKVSRELTTIASYSYTQARYEKYPDLIPGVGFPAAMEGERVEAVPEHLASLWAIYTLHDGYFRSIDRRGCALRGKSESNGLNVDFVTPDFHKISVTTPAYTLFDAMVTYATPRVSLAAHRTESRGRVFCDRVRGDARRLLRRPGADDHNELFYKF